MTSSSSQNSNLLGRIPENWRRAWPLWLFMLLVVALELLGGDTARHLLRYERAAILGDYQLWRMITGHLVHLGPSHMWLNVAALFVGWLLCGDTYSMPRWAILLFGCALGISTAFLLFEPQLNWYVGLSGVLHGLLAAGALALLRMHQPGAWLFVAFLVVKIAWEQLLGPLPFSEATSGGNVVVDAHLYGTISGAILSLLVFKKEAAGRISERNPPSQA